MKPFVYFLIALAALFTCWRYNILFLFEKASRYPSKCSPSPPQTATEWLAFLPVAASAFLQESIDSTLPALCIATHLASLLGCFFVFMLVESWRKKIRGPWAYMTGSLLIAICAAFPLYLFAFQKKRASNPQGTVLLSDILGPTVLSKLWGGLQVSHGFNWWQ